MNTIQKRIEEAAKRYAWSHDTIGVDKYTFHTEALQKAPIPIHNEVRIPIYHEMEVAFKCAAHFILNNLWISVDEDLPPYDKDVFVRFISRFPNNTDEFEVGYCTRWRTLEESVKTDSKGFSIIGDMEITHWMYIPSLEGGEK
jgi:hypothetical protein